MNACICSAAADASKRAKCKVAGSRNEIICHCRRRFRKNRRYGRTDHALATELAGGGHVHLVAHLVSDDLLNLPGVSVHRVPKLANSYTLAGPLLCLGGKYWARHVAECHGRVIVNGGETVIMVMSIGFIICMLLTASCKRTFEATLAEVNRWLDRQKRTTKALAKAKIIIANSNSTRPILNRTLSASC